MENGYSNSYTVPDMKKMMMVTRRMTKRIEKMESWAALYSSFTEVN